MGWDEFEVNDAARAARGAACDRDDTEYEMSTTRRAALADAAEEEDVD